MPVEAILEDQQQKKSRRKLVITILLVVVVLHLLAGVIAGVLVVARYFLPPPAAFQVQKDIRLPAKEREHRMNMDSFEAMTPKPSFNDKLQSLRPTDFSLPELPKVPMDQMLPLDPSAIVADQVSSMVGTAGLGAGGQGGSGMGGTGSGISFLGIETNAKRILLLYDVSTTVTNSAARAGMPMERIRDETQKLLDGLSINTRFGMGQFARNYAFFETELLPATDPNREKARAWLTEWFATDGSMNPSTPRIVRGSPGFIEVMRSAFQLNPDVIFVISDGGFYRGGGGANEQIPYEEIDKAIGEFQKSLPEPAQINFIGVGMKPENERAMRRVLAKHSNGGKFRELKK
jgi:hypothetical protein